MARVAAILSALFIASPSSAQGLRSPQGDPVLIIEGALTHTNDGDRAVFDMAMLRDLPQVSFATNTIWTEGERSFTGVPLIAVLDAVGAQGDLVIAHALNDYEVEIPIAELEEDVPIIAYEMDGAEMSLRQNGPLWVVYPYDAAIRYRTDTAFARSIWHLNLLRVLE
ncbi:molybdopterin-dependent oxidoreductase [Halodurantibacterium flavum]|uniref:Molybdopterin-dependent oxidoreductase n=1 Tax=Halodurantibacterium flavum TaxID=1382802 RepID=A0ABW4S3P1_9RHOB